MKKIADTNFIQNEFLVQEFLSSSPKNQIVLTDYVAIELYNSGNLETLSKTTKALAPYLGQVVVLKDIKRVCGLSGRQAGLQRRLIDEKQTAQLSIFFKEVEAAVAGNKRYLSGYQDKATNAADQLQLVLTGASENADAYSNFASIFTKEELLAIRKQTGITKTMAIKILTFTSDLSAEIFKEHPAAKKFPNLRELHNTYIFRVSLANTVLALWWVGVGGAEKARPEKLRNDAVDCYLASYATFFDGVLSKDEKLKSIYSACRYILSEAFKC
jgi:hypothetical protein